MTPFQQVDCIPATVNRREGQIAPPVRATGLEQCTAGGGAGR